jgi:enoyl-CoA hydratase/carnithine racemase
MITHVAERRTMPEGSVQIKVHPPAGTIILNRPDTRNALSRRLMRELRQALSDLHMERKVRAVVITGAGNAFCAGADLAELHETNQQEDPHPIWHDDSVRYRELLDALLQLPKPIIAAVNGPVLGTGAGLLLAADVVVADRNAIFGLPEPRWGLVAGMIAPLLVFRVGGGHAARVLLTAEDVDAREAHRIGLFHELVDADLVWARSAQIASECARAAPEALQLTRRLLNEMIGEHLGTLLSAGAAVSATAHTTEAAAEGLTAFVEGRDPNWP